MGNKVEISIAANVTGEADVSKLTHDLNGMGASATEAGKGAAATATGLNQAGSASVQASAGLSKTRQGLESISTQLAETQKNLSSLRDQLVAGFSFKQFVTAAADMEKLQAGLTALAGDAALAKDQMEFVARMASKAGVDVTAAGSAFLGLAAATKGTAVEGEPTRKVFEAVSTAMAKAGKSSAETQNALVALAQTASKGTVAMEELRGQLGEALPGALQAAASGMGITTKDLITLVENGKVAAEDLFPALTKGLTDLYGTAPQAQTLSQEITGIKNAFVTMAGAIGDAGALDVLKTGAEGAQTAIVLFGDSLIQIGQVLGTFIAALAHMDFSGFDAAMLEIETSARTRLLKAAEHNTVLTNALKLSSDHAIQAAIYVKEMGDTTAKAGQQANDAAPSYVALGSQYGKNLEVIKELITVTEKEVEAVKARGAAAVEAAKLTNDEQRVREVMAKAVRDESEAMTSLSERRQAELDILKLELQAKREWLAAQSGPISDVRKKELEDAEKAIALKQQEVDKTNAQAAALQAKAKANSEEAIAAETARKSIQATLTLRTAEARAALDVAQGQREIANSTLKIAELSGNDAAIRRAKIAAIEAEIAVTKAKVEVMKAEAQGSIDVSNAEMEELRIKGELTKQKQAELEAAIKVAEAKIKLAEATGQATASSEALIKSLRNSASGMNNLSSSTNGLTTATNGAVAAQQRLQGALTETQAAAKAALMTNEQLQQSLSGDKYGNRPGGLSERNAAISEDSKRRAAARDSASLTFDQLGGANTPDELDRKFNDAKNKLNESVRNNPSAMDDGWASWAMQNLEKQYNSSRAGMTSKSNASRLKALIEKYMSEGYSRVEAEQMAQRELNGVSGPARSDSNAPTGGNRPTTSPTATATGAAAAKTYNVQIGGRTIKTASDADARALIETLKEAQRAA